MNADHSLDDVVSEHRVLRSLLSDIQDQFDSPIVSCKALYSMLSDARRQIGEHFSHEEQDCFQRICQQAPHLESQIDQLRAQHIDFREQLQWIASRLEHSTEDTLFDLSREFDTFLAAYFRHEVRENALLQQAFPNKADKAD